MTVSSPSALCLVAAASAAPGREVQQGALPRRHGPAWEELEGTDGKKHSLADLKDKDVVVVVFTCNSCPVAEGYEGRIIAFAEKYANPDARSALVAINVNTGKDDALPAMKDARREEEVHLPVPVRPDAGDRAASTGRCSRRSSSC